jgi:hypothetical protein
MNLPDLLGKEVSYPKNDLVPKPLDGSSTQMWIGNENALL